MAEERFESIWRFVTLTAGGPWPLHISLRSVVERRRANGREEFSLRFRSLRVVKERKYHAHGRNYIFLSAQLNRVRFMPSNMRWHIRVLYPTFQRRRDRVWYRVKYCILCRRCRKSIRRTCDVGMLGNFSRE